jgi:hypothetical protein
MISIARRIASFDRRAIAAAKSLINQGSLPYADRLLDALNSFENALTWPEATLRPSAQLIDFLPVDFFCIWSGCSV